MKIGCFVFGFFGVFIVASAALVGRDRFVNGHRIVPSPQNQSLFFRTYNPEEMIKGFRSPESFGSGHTLGSAQDNHSVHHMAGFYADFTIESCRKTELTAALRNDVSLRLQPQIMGIQVTAKKEEPDGGLRYDYATANGAGSITLHPPKHANVQRNMVLPPGLEDVIVQIDLEETWNRPASDNFVKWFKDDFVPGLREQ